MDASRKAVLQARKLLSWDETAEYLGFDSEGLRQAMLSDFGTRPGQRWLPVGVDSRGREFLTHLGFNGELHVVEKCLNFDGDGVERDATLSDGSIFEVRGKTETASWEATHDHQSGWSMCFLLGGRLILDPWIVKTACENNGDLRHSVVCLAPREWYGRNPNEVLGYFTIVGRDFNGGFAQPPEDLYRDCFFYTEDVIQISSDTRISAHIDTSIGPWPWGDHETELLRQLAAAAKQFWSTYDRDDQTTAPKNAEVEAWLISQGVAKRTAEIMATLLRPEHIRTGPR